MTDTPLCGGCYPGVGDRGTMCERCLRRELDLADTPTHSHLAIVNHLAELAIPKRFHGARIDELVPELHHVDPLKDGVLLTGLSGRGKTHQAAILTKRGIEYATTRRAVSADAFQFRTATGILTTLRSEFGKKAASTPSLMDRLKAAAVLVIDDLGTRGEPASPWARETFLDLIDQRYAALRPVIVTTNLTLRELEQHLGARIATRLVEMCAVLELQGPQRRVA